MNQPTKREILDWIRQQRYAATEKFEAAKKAEIMGELLGTEVEQKNIEWNEAVDKIKLLQTELNSNHNYYRCVYIYTDDYIKTIVQSKYNELYKEEYNKIELEFNKIHSTISGMRSVKNMLDYLIVCEIPWPGVDAVAEEKPAVDTTVYKPWLQNQLAESNGVE